MPDPVPPAGDDPVAEDARVGDDAPAGEAPADAAGTAAAEDASAEAVRSALGRARAAARAKGLAAGRRPAKGRRGVDRAPRSGSGADGRDPQLFGRSISRLVTERGWEEPVAVGGVLGRWDQVVGAEVAAHCTPETFDDSVLVVRTDSTAWATQMRLLAPTVLRRLAEELGAGVVARLVVKGPSGPTWRKGPRSVSDGRGPRDTYG